MEDPSLYNPEEGWDDDTIEEGVVLDYERDEEVQKRENLVSSQCTHVYSDTITGVAFTAKMLKLKPAANNDFLFQKIFGDGNFIAAGQLVVPPKKQKPTKGTKDNTFVRYFTR